MSGDQRLGAREQRLQIGGKRLILSIALQCVFVSATRVYPLDDYLGYALAAL